MNNERDNNNYFSLEGKFLAASPSMGDPRFSESLIYMISDDIKGSMGIIINKPAMNINIGNFFSNLKDLDTDCKNKFIVHYGGPVEFDKGFILHTNDYKTNEENNKCAEW